MRRGALLGAASVPRCLHCPTDPQTDALKENVQERIIVPGGAKAKVLFVETSPRGDWREQRGGWRRRRLAGIPLPDRDSPCWGEPEVQEDVQEVNVNSVNGESLSKVSLNQQGPLGKIRALLHRPREGRGNGQLNGNYAIEAVRHGNSMKRVGSVNCGCRLKVVGNVEEDPNSAGPCLTEPLYCS